MQIFHNPFFYTTVYFYLASCYVSWGFMHHLHNGPVARPRKQNIRIWEYIFRCFFLFQLAFPIAAASTLTQLF